MMRGSDLVSRQMTRHHYLSTNNYAYIQIPVNAETEFVRKALKGAFLEFSDNLLAIHAFSEQQARDPAAALVEDAIAKIRRSLVVLEQCVANLCDELPSSPRTQKAYIASVRRTVHAQIVAVSSPEAHQFCGALGQIDALLWMAAQSVRDGELDDLAMKRIQQRVKRAVQDVLNSSWSVRRMLRPRTSA